MDFSECHSEEVISFFWRSVYEVALRKGVTTALSINSKTKQGYNNIKGIV